MSSTASALSPRTSAISAVGNLGVRRAYRVDVVLLRRVSTSMILYLISLGIHHSTVDHFDTFLLVRLRTWTLICFDVFVQ